MATAVRVIHVEDFDRLWDPISRSASMHDSVSKQDRVDLTMEIEQVLAAYPVIAAAATPATAVTDDPSFGNVAQVNQPTAATASNPNLEGGEGSRDFATPSSPLQR